MCTPPACKRCKSGDIDDLIQMASEDRQRMGWGVIQSCSVVMAAIEDRMSASESKIDSNLRGVVV